MLGVDGPVWTLIGRAKNYSIHGEFTGEYLDRIGAMAPFPDSFLAPVTCSAFIGIQADPMY